MSRRASTRTPPAGDPERAQTPLEINMAAVENRLRQSTLDLVEPTIHKSTILQEDLDHLKERVTNHAKSINEVNQLQIKAHEHVSMIDHFKEEMGKWDQQRKQHESKVNEDLAVLRQDLDGFDYSLKQKESALQQLNRGGDSTTKELNRLLTVQRELQLQCQDRLDKMSMKISSVHTDLEVKINQLELRHNALSDDLWGDETGLAKVSGELNRTNFQIKQLNDRVAELVETKAPREDLEKLHEEVHTVLREANGSMLGLKRVVGNVVNDVKEHFRTSSNTISAHNATFIEEMRRSYEKEQRQMEQLRKEVNDFLQDTRTDNQKLTSQVEEGVQRMDSLVTELRGDMEELNKKRKRDKTSQDIELKGMKKRLGGVFDHSDVVLRGMEHLNGVLHLVLESERVQAALEFQDNIDRNKIALVGVKADKDDDRDSKDQAEDPRRKFTPRSGASRREAGGVTPGDVMSVDTRCISCSGQAPTVMSAFKMACLKYSPSQVEYEASLYDRRELILRRQKLLDQAMRALAEGGAQTLEAAEGASNDLDLSSRTSPTQASRGFGREPMSTMSTMSTTFGVDSISTAAGRKSLKSDKGPLSGYATFASFTTATEFSGDPERDANVAKGRPSVRKSMVGTPRKSMVSMGPGKAALPPMLTPR